MADSQVRDNSSRIRRNMSKLAYRSKEKVMRSIGRAEETKDEILDHYVMLINKQQLQMQKLHRDMKQYLAALRAMSLSQKAFYDSLYEVYDDDWAGKDVIASCSQRNQLLHDDIFARFQAEVTDTLQNHLTEYNDCKLRVEKRSRKLVDYDAARRTLQSLEASRKPDPTKLQRAQEHVRITKERYEELNSQLHEQLPTLYDSRLPVCTNTFSSICESEKVFSNEIAEMRDKLNNVLLSLKSAFDGGQYHIQRMRPPMDNGRVAATTSSSESAQGTNNSSPAKIMTSSTASSQSPTKSNKEGSIPPRSPNDASKSPGSDPSTHEYVNLQVGSIPDVVRPVTEEDENTSPSKGSNDGDKNNARTLPKPKDELYLSPTVNKNQEDISYIMASDPSLSARKSDHRPKIPKPKPSPRSQVFRIPSDTKDTRPPIPKPLPRTLSAPTTERPLHLKKNNTSIQGNWRSHKNQYTDVHLRSHNRDAVKQSTSSLREQRPEFPMPDTQLPSHSPTANGGDNVVAQPIYEEPPDVEDLPSYNKPNMNERPPEPVPKSPTKSVDSHRYLDLPPNYLFSVQALYQYKSTDEDELGFDKGDIIHIIQHPDPEEQDDGWQMGIRQKDWEQKSDLVSCMGVFPENFTKRIQL